MLNGNNLYHCMAQTVGFGAVFYSSSTIFRYNDFFERRHLLEFPGFLPMLRRASIFAVRANVMIIKDVFWRLLNLG